MSVSPARRPGTAEPSLSLAVTHLMKGVVYRDTHEIPWRHLLQLQPQVRDYVGVLGLTVVIDEAEGYAFLRSKPDLDDDNAQNAQNGQAIPRLIARRSLSFHVSLLLALLRKKLTEFDARNADSKLVLSRDQIVDMVRVFLPDGSNEARLVDQIDAHITRVTDLGFLRRTKDREPHYEVRRILKAFVDGQWLADFDERIAAYAAQLGGGAGTTDGDADGESGAEGGDNGRGGGER
ncbi:DUF4194 domain-containing protein [Actinopolymorpha sp. B11F2]|uniref:DUF4194 domain-containing protein n=1 Tax=Actinopolymorpha sp. B11F2 TaxID=3160862 RepID=UPI0032E4B037